MQPRLIRLRDAPHYLGINKNRFNKMVRPLLVEIPIRTQEVAFHTVNSSIKIISPIHKSGLANSLIKMVQS